MHHSFIYERPKSGRRHTLICAHCGQTWDECHGEYAEAAPCTTEADERLGSMNGWTVGR